MKNHYKDILERIPYEPLWYDENGVPRYRAFKPDLLANIYHRESVLLEVECQWCGMRFDVGLSISLECLHNLGYKSIVNNLDKIPLSLFFYGDPPFHEVNGGMCAGCSMTSNNIRIIQAWDGDRCVVINNIKK